MHFLADPSFDETPPASPPTPSLRSVAPEQFVRPVDPAALPAAGSVDRVSRAVLHGLLGRMSVDALVVLEDGRTHRFGPAGAAGQLAASLTVHDPRAYGAVLRRGSIGLGDAYVEGWWDSDDLVETLRVLLRHVVPLDRLGAGWHRLHGPVTDPIRRLRRPDPFRDRADIHAHYDLGNEFFAAFLDESMLYSCGIFEHADASLTDAQHAKIDRLCQRLELSPDDHLLEIGTGWGGLAIRAAQQFGCRVTTTTISDEQFDMASRRVAEAGVGDRVTVLAQDFRDLDGTFDKLVSVEMIEAVDWREYDSFFSACSRLLRPGGLAAVQAIVISDQSFEHRKHRRDFIKARIFPGGCVPSVTALLDASTRAADLRVLALEDIGRHYPPTLRAWRERFLDSRPALRRLGVDERFERLWVFYLAFCEAGFLERHVSTVHLLFARPGSPAAR